MCLAIVTSQICNTFYVVKMKKWSSQRTQFMQLRKEAWKKFRTSTGFEPVTSRLAVRCSTNWAMKPLTLGAGQLWVHMFPWKKWVLMIYEINHIWTAEMKWKWRNDRRSERNLCNCGKKPGKKIQVFATLPCEWINILLRTRSIWFLLDRNALRFSLHLAESVVREI